MKESKRCQSLCSSDASEVEEPEYLLEVDDDLPVLTDQSHLLDDYHLEKVNNTHLYICVWITAINGFSPEELRKL